MNRELANKARLLASTVSDHPWSTKTNERDSRAITRLAESLLVFADDILAVEIAVREDINRLEAENKRLKAESWEDGDTMTRLRIEIDTLKMTIATLEQNALPYDHMERAEWENRQAGFPA